MQSFCNLHVLTITDALANYDDEFVIKPLHLPNLHTIRVRSCTEACFPQLKHWIMPRLCHLYFSSMSQVDNALPFFRVYGKQLETLEFDVPHPEFHLILDRCPNLQDLIFSLYTFVIHPPSSPPNVCGMKPRLHLLRAKKSARRTQRAV